MYYLWSTLSLRQLFYGWLSNLSFGVGIILPSGIVFCMLGDFIFGSYEA